MTGINRDTICAVVLLLLTGTFVAASFDIREPDYGTLAPSTWPQIVLAYLGALSAVYLVQSLRAGPDAQDDITRDGSAVGRFLSDYRNPIWCYVLFAGFLLVLPYLGMLGAGIAFVFALLTALGGASKALLIRHLVIATVMVGAMWTLFTYGLGVLLPSGSLFGGY